VSVSVAVRIIGPSEMLDSRQATLDPTQTRLTPESNSNSPYLELASRIPWPAFHPVNTQAHHHHLLVVVIVMTTNTTSMLSWKAKSNLYPYMP